MTQDRASADPVQRTTAGAACDRVTLHAFMFTLTMATATVLAYGPRAAAHHIADVLSAAGRLSPGPDAWSGAPTD